jgi:hypothetical protein
MGAGEVEITKWLGLRNNAAPERFRPGDLKTALDVDVDDAGALRSRHGYVEVSSTASHSMFAKDGLCVVVQDVDMKRMDSAGALTQLARLQYGGPVSYAELDGVVYFSNGVDTGRIAGGRVYEWGVRPPVSQPSAAAGAGSLPPARYLYAMTFVRSDGIESGSRVPGLVELTVSGGLVFSGMEVSTDPLVAGKALYLSAPNGTELYRVAVVPALTSSYVYANAGLDLGPPLHSDTVEPAPAGTIVEIHDGVAYVVDGSVAWASDQYNLERFRRAARFVQLPGMINLFAAVTDGVFAATDDGTWFLSGPDLATATKVLSYGAVPGTAVKFDGEQLLAEDERTGASNPAVMWMSPDGVIMGTSGGQVKNLTENRYSLPTAQRGAALFRVARGYASYIASMRGNGAAPSAY